MPSAEFSRVERSILMIALLFIILIAVKMTAYIVSLVMMSIVLTMLAVPAQVWLRN
ncbi:MAG: AI-2E family transporter, partial [Methanomicrobiales archaeon]|nr:AI-2E family transporter [Methanomicrobiales archaeon]